MASAFQDAQQSKLNRRPNPARRGGWVPVGGTSAASLAFSTSPLGTAASAVAASVPLYRLIRLPFGTPQISARAASRIAFVPTDELDAGSIWKRVFSNRRASVEGSVYLGPTCSPTERSDIAGPINSPLPSRETFAGHSGHNPVWLKKSCSACVVLEQPAETLLANNR